MAKINKKTEEIISSLITSRVDDQSIISEVHQSFLDYSMSVITARALPDVRDGLKPVHRRILYAAFLEGLTSDKKPRKSANLVGKVMSQFHPHGDSSIYEALVRLSQDFNMRYPLIDGQGNFGSIDGDSAAAMRYTEARLSKIGGLLLEDIKENTVNFVPNYDGLSKEPVVLPAIFPNLLINGVTGIAVGLATTIPPHNLGEVCDAILALLNNPELTIKELATYIKGPDFPTGGEVLDTEGIYNYLSTGRGGFMNRAKVDIETIDNSKFLVVKEIPYALNKTKLIEKIVNLVRPLKTQNRISEIADNIKDIRDESNREGIRLLIELKNDAIPEIVLNSLFIHSDLQQRYSTNLVAIVDKQPKQLNVLEVLQLYIEHQINVLLRKTQFNLNKTIDRIHILEGRRIIAENIFDVIEIITENDSPESILSERYQLSEIQVTDVLNLPLKSVKRIEKEKLTNELLELDNLKKDFEETLASKNKQNQILSEKIKWIKEKFSDPRRTIINHNSSGSISKEQLIPNDPVVVTLSQKNYIKRVPLDIYKTHKRGGIGVKGLNTYSDDEVKMLISTTNHKHLLLFTNRGKVFRTKVFDLPQSSRTAKGKPIIDVLNSFPKDDSICSILPIDDYQDGSLLFATKKGIIKKTKIKEFIRINVNGKIALKIAEDDALLSVVQVYEEDEVLLASSNGKIVRFDSKKLRNMGRTARGNKGMKLINQESLISASSSNEGNLVLSISVRGIGKLTPLYEYRKTNRNSKGVIGQKQNERTGSMLMCIIVKGDEDILLMNKTGNINRFNLKDVSIVGRNSSGVKLFNLEENDILVYATKSISILEEENLEATNNKIIEDTNNNIN